MRVPDMPDLIQSFCELVGIAAVNRSDSAASFVLHISSSLCPRCKRRQRKEGVSASSCCNS